MSTLTLNKHDRKVVTSTLTETQCNMCYDIYIVQFAFELLGLTKSSVAEVVPLMKKEENLQENSIHNQILKQNNTEF